MTTRLNNHIDTLEEEALTSKNSLTRLYILEEARRLD